MMSIDRRGLLLGGSAAALAACAGSAPTTRSQAEATDATEFDPFDWASVRAQFPLDTNLVHLAAFVLAAHPKPVRAAIDRHRQELDADTEGYLQETWMLEENVRAAAASYLGAEPGQIALTDSTTMGTGLLYSGLRLVPGQDIVTTTHDFHATVEGLRLLVARTGAPMRRVALYDNPRAATETEILARVRAAIGPRTRVVALTWVHSGTGVRLPIPAVAELIAELNNGRAPADRALLCVDGVHGFGVVDAGVVDLGCDFLTTGTHKWLFGPRGTGLLWGRAWDALAPLIPTFSGTETPGAVHTPGGYHSFEHRWAVREAFDFHRRIGRARIAKRVTEQATQLKAGLRGIPTVTLITPDDPNLSAGIVCCEVDGMDAFTATRRLREQHRIVASVTPYEQQYLRFGPSMVTTPEQIDRTIEAVKLLR
ncbi:aminotransferase class V-fold PLP-dependent enzyme [Actinosynnema sp. ALI-1.44]|uniref:aminotransferase class V-fold PLP-dependent enzyme n=1 Tax=Actinosynnema sp. ALI-1.44 TaxID=1933779 RepID=UPI0011780D4C|nr:aminotransferase class V-fold PLP-dependent enzyme [Actinosynnema sp. ALI-1.44]